MNSNVTFLTGDCREAWHGPPAVQRSAGGIPVAVGGRAGRVVSDHAGGFPVAGQHDFGGGRAANAIRTLRADRTDAAPTDRVIGLSPLQIQRRFTAAARAAGIEARVTAHSGRTTHPLVPSRPAEPVLHRRDFGPR